MKIHYYVRFDPNIYPASAYSLWDAETHELVCFELSESEARTIYNTWNEERRSKATRQK